MNGAKKLTYEYVKNFIEVESDSRCKLISKEYISSQTNMVFNCHCGEEFKATWSNFKHHDKRQCNKCGGRIQWNQDLVKQYIEFESNSGCKLLSKNYINGVSKIFLKCSCGNEFQTTFSNFKNANKRCCDNCTNNQMSIRHRLDLSYVKEYVESYGCDLLSDNYINNSQVLNFKCLTCGNLYSSSFSNFSMSKHKCPSCAIESIKDIKSFSEEHVKGYLAKYGYKLLSEYINCDISLKIECPQGHLFDMDFYHFKNRGQRCWVCYSLKDRSGKNSSTWQGGRTELNLMLRNELKDWKQESLKAHDYKCFISGSNISLNVHHIKSFNIIIKEILDYLKIPFKKQVCDYTELEISHIKQMVVEYHKDNLGIPLCEELHKSFHSRYGFDNSKEQLMNFIQNFDTEG